MKKENENRSRSSLQQLDKYEPFLVLLDVWLIYDVLGSRGRTIRGWFIELEGRSREHSIT